MQGSIAWKILDSYFASNPYFTTKHHLESYNEYVTKFIPLTLRTMNPFTVVKYDEEKNNKKYSRTIEMYIGGEDVSKIYYTKPVISEEGSNRMLLPNEARLKNLTYSCELRADVTVKVVTRNGREADDVVSFDIQDILISRIPIMLHSKLCILANKSEKELRELGECPYDQGGYFVVDGKEKVIVAQDNNVTNKLFITPANDDKYTSKARITCTAEKTSVFPKTFLMYVLAGKSKDTAIRRNAIVVRVPHINVDVPLFILFRALGIECDKDIVDMILLDREAKPKHLEFLRASVVDANFTYTQQQALVYLSQFVEYRSVNHVQYIMYNDLLPNIESNLYDKSMFLAYVTRSVIDNALGIIPFSNRDNFMYKRVDISGLMLSSIFKDFYNDFRNQTRSATDRLYNRAGKTVDIKTLLTDGRDSIFNQSEKALYGMIKSLKGDWGLRGTKQTKSGVVQDLSRISYIGFVSHLRRVSSSMDETIKIRAPHELTGSQWGIMCPCESPDGASVGLLKNLSILTHVTPSVPSQVIVDLINDINVVVGFKSVGTLKMHEVDKYARVFINHNWIGNVEDPVALTTFLRIMKRCGSINRFTSVCWDVFANEIFIFTDAGRCCRPLIALRDAASTAQTAQTADTVFKRINELYKGKKPTDVKWTELTGSLDNMDMYYSPFKGAFAKPVLKKNATEEDVTAWKIATRAVFDNALADARKRMAIMEFVDVEEANRIYVAMSRDDLKTASGHTHCEIHPTTIMSAYTCTIPLADHNQAPRNIFSGAQGKQAIGVYATSFNNRIDTMAYVLHYPQQALVSTRYMQHLNMNDLPNGENVIVAVATYSGYNQEDSIIINKSSMERGMFNLTYFKSYISEEQRFLNEAGKMAGKETFANPNALLQKGQNVEIGRYANYTKIDADGMPMLNEYIMEGDVVVGKVKPVVKKDEYGVNTTVQESICDVADKTVEGYVDKVVRFKNSENMDVVKIRLRKMRVPVNGDKLCSRHGQKGVIGMVMPAEMMPFNADGMVPDIIINPHAFPSRMTIGHLLECILAKGAVYSGNLMDATPFEDYEMDRGGDILEQFGLNRHGDEIMYNGVSGEQMTCEIFFGPTYYFRLKHMIADKINYRDTGRKVNLTMQPTKGRGNNGGLRIGEMETNVLISHGIASFAKESLMNRSDMARFLVSKDHGHIFGMPKGKRQIHDSYDDTAAFSQIEVPYAFKLLTHEIQAFSVMPQLITNFREEIVDEDDDNDDGDYENINGDEEKEIYSM